MKQSLKQRNIGYWMAGLCCLAMALCGVGSASGQQNAATSTAAVPAVSTFAPTTFSAVMPGVVAAHPVAKAGGEEEQESPKPRKPGGEGVKVHGHWVIDLKDTDGKIIEHRDFQNSLVTNGALQGGDLGLASVISGDASPGGLSIVFVNVDTATNTDATQYCGGIITPSACYGFTSSNNIITTAGIGFNAIATGLTSTVILGQAGTTPPTSSLVLSGNFTIPAGLNTINAVETYLSLCEPTGAITAPGFIKADLAPNACVASQPPNPNEYKLAYPLTSTTITSGTPPAVMPLNVTPGQVLTVTVTISFS